MSTVIKKLSNNPRNVARREATRLARIAKDNKVFKKMSTAEKRVQIAKDVLAQLGSKRLIAKRDIWLDVPGLVSNNSDLELKEILSNTKSCKACAMGGLFMCALERTNNLKIKDLEDYNSSTINSTFIKVSTNDTYNYLQNFFSKSQLDLIETAFELGAGAAHITNVKTADKAVNFGLRYTDLDERMFYIMKNIIENEGSFKP